MWGLRSESLGSSCPLSLLGVWPSAGLGTTHFQFLECDVEITSGLSSYVRKEKYTPHICFSSQRYDLYNA